MELIGTIEAGAGLATGKAEWIRVLKGHPQLSPVPPEDGTNPFSFSRKPLPYPRDPTTAHVRIDGNQVGSIHWVTDGSRRLLVWSIAGAEEKVGNVATDVASRLGWHFVRGYAAPIKLP